MNCASRLQPDPPHARFAMYVSFSTAALAATALSSGILAVPATGANCPARCISYPYLDIGDRFPRDYLWMYPAILLMVAYMLFMVVLRLFSAPERAVFSDATVALSGAATMVLGATYFTQSSVVPASLAAGETEGITLLTMYNPHGMFIALEEFGYLLMSASFLFAAFMIIAATRILRIVRWVFTAGLVIPLVALVSYSLVYGLDRQDRFEVVVLTTDWLVLMANGILIGLVVRNRLRTHQHGPAHR